MHTHIQHKGFTLIELVIALVVISVSFSILSVLLFPQARQSAEPMLQHRALSLAHAIITEVKFRSFDEQSDRGGGFLRCGDNGAPSCTSPANLGPDASDTSRERFNDIDDYHQLESGGLLLNALGEDIAAQYPDYTYRIDVCYSDSAGECVNSITSFKRILVAVTTPLGDEFILSTIRGNY